MRARRSGIVVQVSSMMGLMSRTGFPDKAAQAVLAAAGTG
jgi:hypothetical protein